MCRRVACARQSWSEKVKLGVLSGPGPDGKYDVIDATAEWVANRTRERADGTGGSRKIKPAGGSKDWGAVLEQEKAMKARLERRELQGQLVRRDAVTREAAEFAVLVRDRLRNVPMRLRDRVAAETSPRVCGEIIAAEIDRALTVLAGGLKS
jgi:phage terminase Nu1 subunit (DNA packaging protein)